MVEERMSLHKSTTEGLTIGHASRHVRECDAVFATIYGIALPTACQATASGNDEHFRLLTHDLEASL